VRRNSDAAGEAHVLFNTPMSTAPPFPYDVTADGQRILAILPRNASEGLTVVTELASVVEEVSCSLERSDLTLV